MIFSKVLKKILRIVAIILPCFASVFFFSSDSFATSQTINIVNTGNTTICDNRSSSLPHCSDFSYILFSYDVINRSTDPSTSFSFKFTNWTTGGGGNISYINPFMYTSILPNDNTSTHHVDLVTGVYGSPSEGLRNIVLNFPSTISSYVSNISVTLMDSSPFGSSPSGSISLTSNGTYDVSSYAEAVVDVPPIPGDYHDDLLSVRNAILICGAVLIVLYFFYAIYKMILGGTR